jgi:acyl-CoA synthetase (AMP-forming)/AMP-acid ligase II
MTHHRTFTDLILDRAASTPEREALLLLPESEERGRAGRVSYGALDAAARELAGWLQARGAAGERVLLMHTSRRQFTVSFLACLYAGAIAVPAPPTGGGGGAPAAGGGGAPASSPARPWAPSTASLRSAVPLPVPGRS